jgi:hypothetical protein
MGDKALQGPPGVLLFPPVTAIVAPGGWASAKRPANVCVDRNEMLEESKFVFVCPYGHGAVIKRGYVAQTSKNRAAGL